MKIEMIGRIARTVGNIDEAQNWYELVLELPHLYRFGSLSFFDCNGTRLMLSQQEKLNLDESILYFKVADILLTHSNLQRKAWSLSLRHIAFISTVTARKNGWRFLRIRTAGRWL